MFSRIVAHTADRFGTPFFVDEHVSIARLAARQGLDRWGGLWEKIGRMSAAVDGINLDHAQSIAQILSAMADPPEVALPFVRPTSSPGDDLLGCRPVREPHVLGRLLFVTTPIYYVNDVPHIGHAYTTIACDAMARFAKLDGKDVRFLTGTDEHGQKVEKAAHDRGIEPQAFTDDLSQRFRDLVADMGIANDDFIRTTEERHKDGVKALWQGLVETGDIYLGGYAGWYAVRDEAFYTESELIDGKAPTGAPVEWVEEPSYFFRLSAWQEKLLAFYEQNPGLHRTGESTE